MSPTRELATQTTTNIGTVGEFCGILAHTCIGGKSISERTASSLQTTTLPAALPLC